MGLAQLDKVDVVGIDNATGNVILTVADEMDWQDEYLHLSLLQGKLNSYLAFVESGEMLKSYPVAKNRPVRIRVAFRCRPTPQGEEFLRRVAGMIEEAGFTLEHQFRGEEGASA